MAIVESPGLQTKAEISSIQYCSMIHIPGYLRNKWSLRSLARCLIDALDIQISFKHLQRITRDLGVRCKWPKLELLRGKAYEEGGKRASGKLQACSNSFEKKE
jgi:hypothetical protein